MMAGMHRTTGSLLPFSQFSSVVQQYPRRLAAFLWLIPSSRRRFRIRSPRVLGSKSVSLGFRHLGVIRANGKKATRLCSCGFLGHYSGRCHCTPDQVSRYRRKISGPLLDRIDLHIEVPALPPEDLSRKPTGESSEVARTISDLAGDEQVTTSQMAEAIQYRRRDLM